MLKGPKRSFVVFLVILDLGVESSSKNAPNGTKKFRKQNLLKSKKTCSKGNKNCSLTKCVPNPTKYGTKGARNVRKGKIAPNQADEELLAFMLND